MNEYEKTIIAGNIRNLVVQIFNNQEEVSCGYIDEKKIKRILDAIYSEIAEHRKRYPQNYTTPFVGQAPDTPSTSGIQAFLENHGLRSSPSAIEDSRLSANYEANYRWAYGILAGQSK